MEFGFVFENNVFGVYEILERIYKEGIWIYIVILERD